MFKLTYAELRDKVFIQAMNKLSSCSDLDYKTSYNVMRAGKLLETKLKESQSEWIKIAGKYIAKEDNGNFKFVDGKPIFYDNVPKEEAETAIDSFMKKEVLLDRKKFKLENLAPAKLTPNELSTLEFMIEEP